LSISRTIWFERGSKRRVAGEFVIPSAARAPAMAKPRNFYLPLTSPRQALTVVMKVLPELWPALLQSGADKDVRMITRLLIHQVVRIRDLPRELTCSEIAVAEPLREPEHDQCLRRRIAIPAIPIGINAAD